MSEFKRAVGYVPSTPLSIGIDKTVKWYEANKKEASRLKKHYVHKP